MAAVAAYFRYPGTQQQLREVSLAARLVLRAQGVASRLSGLGGIPNIVSLVKGEVQEQTSLLLTEILVEILAAADPVLQVQSAVLHLMNTYITMIWRFDSYYEYPFRLALLVKSWNPVFFAREAMLFLQAADDDVDVGFGLPLRRAAWRGASNSGGQGQAHTQGQAQAQGQAQLQSALNYLFSEPVQCQLKAVCAAVLTTSLDVERSHNVVKQASERLSGLPSSVSLASRTHILQQYHLWRRTQMKVRRSEVSFIRKRKFINAQALAVRENSAILPQGTGHLRWEEHRP